MCVVAASLQMNAIGNYNLKVLILVLYLFTSLGGVDRASAGACHVEGVAVFHIEPGLSMAIAAREVHDKSDLLTDAAMHENHMLSELPRGTAEHSAHIESPASMNAAASHGCGCVGDTFVCSGSLACASDCVTAYCLTNTTQPYSYSLTQSRIDLSAQGDPAQASITAPFRPPRCSSP